MGVGFSDIMLEGQARVIHEFAEEGDIAFGNRLRISFKQSHALDRWAKFLEITVQDLIGWFIQDGLDMFEDPASGVLQQWVEEMLEYGNGARERRVKARFKAWVKEKGDDR